jgi:prepilin-type N-terminal cleavage/methylation domain-containing protein
LIRLREIVLSSVPTSTYRRTRKRQASAFTLIEVTVVILVIAIMAALVLPNMVAIEESRQRRAAEATLQRLPAEAREESRRLKAPVTLRVDGDDLVMERWFVGEDAGRDPEEVKRISLYGGVKIANVRQGSESISPEEWEWTAYPDGSAPSANLEVTEGDNTKMLYFPSEGDARWLADGEEDPSEGGWSAGEVVVRG